MTEFISLGENCLPDDVLSFLGLKNESYPFGGGRFNIEYIIQLIESDFDGLLDTENLSWGQTEAKAVVRNNHYTFKHDIYSETVTLGFEFTHHNVFEEAPRRSFVRKIERFRKVLQSGNNIVFFYNYRYSEKNDIKTLENLIEQFLDALKKKYGHQYKCLIVYQTLNQPTRAISTRQNESIFIAEFITKNEWEGDEYWNGSPDRDLFKKLYDSSSFQKFAYGPAYFIRPLITKSKSLIKKLLGKS